MITTGKEIIENLDDLVVLKEEARAVAKEKLLKIYEQLQTENRQLQVEIIQLREKLEKEQQKCAEQGMKLMGFESQSSGE